LGWRPFGRSALISPPGSRGWKTSAVQYRRLRRLMASQSAAGR
jgi:hypothetical protein